MPINGVLDLQRRSLALGEIRIGESAPGKNGGRTPKRLDKFRFTTPVQETAAAIAERLGGTPAPWDRRKGYWVVDTGVSELDVWVPPRGLAVDAWMEMWDGGRCLRRCDGITETRSGQPCLCPQPEDRTDRADVARAAAERKRLAGLKPPKGCKPLTRINLAIPWLPGALGVWRLNTGSANAAVETADTGEILERARALDKYLPAVLLIHWRQGQDGHPYPVPVLRPRPSAEQLAALPAGMDGMLAQLHAGSGPLALTAGTPATDTPEPAAPAIETGEGETKAEIAQRMASLATLAQTREDVEKLRERAKADGVLGETVTVWAEIDGATEEVHSNLQEALRGRWQELPAPAPARPARQQAPAAAPNGDGGLWAADLPPEPQEDGL